MSQELTLRNRESVALSPYDVVETATQQSRLLMNIVEQTKCFQVISGKKYLQVEAWETIGAFNRVHAVTESITPIMDDGVKVGYDAKVTLINQDGLLVGAAIMPCYFTENACKGKEGDAKDKACKSAAQTFATSKAYRMNYSYVAILAGYQPTPAEEMTGESVDDRPANLEHWCEEHKTKFFKKGKMQGYAHQLEGGGWHNEPVTPTFPKPKSVDLTDKYKDKLMPTITLEDAAKQGTMEQVDTNATEAVQGAVTAEATQGNIDLDWLKESLGQLKWKNAEVVAWIAGKQIYKGLALTGSLSQVVERMTKEQVAFLVAEIEGRLKMV